MIVTTLNRIRAHQPCADGWGKLLNNLGVTKASDEPLTFATILESNGLDDVLWCCRVEPQYAREWRLYAVWCARQVQHLTMNKRSLNAIDVAERHANGQATDDELKTAWAGARDAVWGSGIDAAMDAANAVAWDVAWDVAWATARATAWATARATAWDAALSAAWAGMRAAAMDAARAAAWDRASDAAMAAQSREFLRVVTETEASVIDSYAEAIMAVKAKND